MRHLKKLAINALEELHNSKNFVYNDKNSVVGFVNNVVVIDDESDLVTYTIICASRKQAEQLAKAISNLFIVLGRPLHGISMLRFMSSFNHKLVTYETMYRGNPRRIYIYAFASLGVLVY